MPIIEIDKSVFQEIENVIELRDKMYENQIATTKKLTDSIEQAYEQEVKKLRNQLQQKGNIIKEVKETLEEANEWVLGVGLKTKLFEILDKEVNKQ